VFVDGVLVPVGLLVNGWSIFQEDVAEVTYYHLELPEHHVLLAQGLPCESYLDTGDRSAFGNSRAPVALHPSFAPAAIWEAMGCRPLVRSGTRLDQVRERLRVSANPIEEFAIAG
jgi:hypothetical protein